MSYYQHRSNNDRLEQSDSLIQFFTKNTEWNEDISFNVVDEDVDATFSRKFNCLVLPKKSRRFTENQRKNTMSLDKKVPKTGQSNIGWPGIEARSALQKSACVETHIS